MPFGAVNFVSWSFFARPYSTLMMLPSSSVKRLVCIGVNDEHPASANAAIPAAAILENSFMPIIIPNFAPRVT